ncbi:DUF6804 family protein [Parafrigoribacterium soli]|uniref:DUF6804 family protein n=1 Tax=Parafrigoribacterium soli TaxID=3144663 RepID=UPI0032EBE980
MTSYPAPEFRRTALAPGILAAIVLLAGLALLDSGDGYLWIRFPVSILGVIVGIYAWQSKQFWWLVGLVPIVVLWNPVFIIELHGQFWVAMQFVAALVFIAAGILIKIRNPDARKGGRPAARPQRRR